MDSPIHWYEDDRDSNSEREFHYPIEKEALDLESSPASDDNESPVPSEGEELEELEEEKKRKKDEEEDDKEDEEEEDNDDDDGSGSKYTYPYVVIPPRKHARYAWSLLAASAATTTRCGSRIELVVVVVEYK